MSVWPIWGPNFPFFRMSGVMAGSLTQVRTFAGEAGFDATEIEQLREKQVVLDAGDAQ